MSLVEAPLEHRIGHDTSTDASWVGEAVTFRWHWPVGTFRRRMSALEIAALVLPHMPSITGLLSMYPRAQKQFAAMLVKLATPEILARIANIDGLVPGTEIYDRVERQRKEAIDHVVPWIRRVERCEEDEILELNIGATQVPSGPIFNTFRRAI